MQDDNIETIIDQLNRLTIQQEQLTKQIVKLQNEVRNRTTKATVDTNNNSKRPIVVGDRVRIKNPRRNQPNTGVVDSFTKSGLFARVKLDNDTVINRAPRNLTRIST
jgi:putative ribosome biogenesis GTPase RsgA